MNTAEVRNDRVPTNDEIAAAVLAIHAHCRRAALPRNQVSGWRRVARVEAIGQALPSWGRKSWAR
jgi:hypothetical protein